MYRNKKIAVVVPSYNEEERIGQVIETMPQFVDSIVVVDDASRDGTSRVVEDHQKSRPDRLFLVRHDRRRGVGGAILSGYEWANENGLEIVAVMAGDGQMDPRELTLIVDPVV